MTNCELEMNSRKMCLELVVGSNLAYVWSLHELKAVIRLLKYSKVQTAYFKRFHKTEGEICVKMLAEK